MRDGSVIGTEMRAAAYHQRKVLAFAKLTLKLTFWERGDPSTALAQSKSGNNMS